jgi:hypothetical protein
MNQFFWLMALIQCKECNEPVSTEAVACPHCGAPQPRTVPPLLPVQSKEETIYADNIVAITSSRVIIWGTTYALRNITSVRMTLTPPQVAGAIFLLFCGLVTLLFAYLSFDETKLAQVGTYVIACALIGGSILWMAKVKSTYHINLASTAGEIHALTSKNKAYIERVVLSVNEAIAKQQ